MSLLSYLELEGTEHDLDWIPPEIPPNVFVLISTLPGRVSQYFMIKVYFKHFNMYVRSTVMQLFM